MVKSFYREPGWPCQLKIATLFIDDRVRRWIGGRANPGGASTALNIDGSSLETTVKLKRVADYHSICEGPFADRDAGVGADHLDVEARKRPT